MEHQNNDLGTWVHSLDREVTVLGRSQASMRSTIDAVEERVVRMEAGIDKLIDLQAIPKPPMQLLGAIGIIATLVLAFGVFMELRLTPTELMIGSIQKRVLIMGEQIDKGFIELSASEAHINHLNEQFKHLDFQHHQTQERVRVNEVATASTRAALEEGRK